DRQLAEPELSWRASARRSFPTCEACAFSSSDYFLRRPYLGSLAWVASQRNEASGGVGTNAFRGGPARRTTLKAELVRRGKYLVTVSLDMFGHTGCHHVTERGISLRLPCVRQTVCGACRRH